MRVGCIARVACCGLAERVVSVPGNAFEGHFLAASYFVWTAESEFFLDSAARRAWMALVNRR